MKLRSPHDNPYSSLNQAVEKLRKKGYKAEFTVKDEKTLKDKEGNDYAPGDLVINEVLRIAHRPEGIMADRDMQNDPTESIYALSAKNGTKGLVINEFEEGGNDVADRFLQNVDRHDDLHANYTS